MPLQIFFLSVGQERYTNGLSGLVLEKQNLQKHGHE